MTRQEEKGVMLAAIVNTSPSVLISAAFCPKHKFFSRVEIIWGFRVSLR